MLTKNDIVKKVCTFLKSEKYKFKKITTVNEFRI